MIQSNQLYGCHVALITPMIPRGNSLVVNFDRLYELIDQCLDAGVSGLLFAGTTGQSATLNHEEQIDLCIRAIDYARRHAKARNQEITCIASAGSNCTEEALMMSREIVEVIEPDALLHVTGYYNNPPQEGLRAHFELIADEMAERDTSMILYNIPGRTGSLIEPDTMIHLAQHPAIAGVKDATGDLASLERIANETDRDSFAILSGEDHLVCDVIKLGGVGVISASGNRWPAEFQRLTELANAGQMEEAMELQRALQPCIDAVFSVKNPIPLHHMLNSSLRLPLVSVPQLDEKNREHALSLIAKAEAVKDFPHMPVAVAQG